MPCTYAYKNYENFMHFIYTTDYDFNVLITERSHHRFLGNNFFFFLFLHTAYFSSDF